MKDLKNNKSENGTFQVLIGIGFCLLIISMVFNVIQAIENNKLNKGLKYIHLCLEDKDVTKDLIAVFINDEGYLECQYGISNEMAEKKVLKYLVRG